MNKLFNFVSMCCLLFLVYAQFSYIQKDWCSLEFVNVKQMIFDIHQDLGL